MFGNGEQFPGKSEEEESTLVLGTAEHEEVKVEEEGEGELGLRARHLRRVKIFSGRSPLIGMWKHIPLGTTNSRSMYACNFLMTNCDTCGRFFSCRPLPTSESTEKLDSGTSRKASVHSGSAPAAQTNTILPVIRSSVIDKPIGRDAKCSVRHIIIIIIIRNIRTEWPATRRKREEDQLTDLLAN